MNSTEPFAFGLLLASVLLRFAEEASLIKRLRSRDPEAMAELYDRYGRVVFSVVFRIVRDRATAEDLVQESFLRVWNRVASFDAEKGALGPWLLTVARNQALDYIRSAEGRAWGNMKNSDTERAGLFCNKEGEMLDAVELDRVRAALGKLTERQKELIQLAYFEGLSQTGMAERMHQPLGTVKTWMRAALKLLREELGVAASV